MRPQVLIILHQEHSSPGRVGHALEQLGFTLDIRRPRFGDPLPATMADHAGAVMFGGPMSANDPDDFVKREIDWLAVPLRDEAPFLGICLGAQMLAKQLGARVSRHREGRVEIGFHPIVPTEAGRALLPCWPNHVYQWHNEGFEAPAGATVLAASEDFPVQMIKVGKAAYGVQFHPELTHAMRYKWCTRGAHRFSLPGAQDRATQIAGQWLHDPPLRRFLDDLLGLWQREVRDAHRPKPAATRRPRRKVSQRFRAQAWA
jgi:GMP synthase (glutamine-hydrolysing)